MCVRESSPLFARGDEKKKSNVGHRNFKTKWIKLLRNVVGKTTINEFTKYIYIYIHNKSDKHTCTHNEWVCGFVGVNRITHQKIKWNVCVIDVDDDHKTLFEKCGPTTWLLINGFVSIENENHWASANDPGLILHMNSSMHVCMFFFFAWQKYATNYSYPDECVCVFVNNIYECIWYQGVHATEQDRQHIINEPNSVGYAH